MLWSYSRIIESSAYAVRQRDLTIRVLEDVGIATMEYAMPS